MSENTHPWDADPPALQEAIADRLAALLARRYPVAEALAEGRDWAQALDRESYEKRFGPGRRARALALLAAAGYAAILDLGIAKATVKAATYLLFSREAYAAASPEERRAFRRLLRAVTLLRRLVRAGCVARGEGT